MKNSDGNESVDEILQFLIVYQVTPNTHTNFRLPLAELMFARKVKSIFNKVLPKENKKEEKTQLQNLYNRRKDFSKNIVTVKSSGMLVS